MAAARVGRSRRRSAAKRLPRAMRPQVLGALELLEYLEGAAVVDHPHPPVLVDEQVAEVSVEVEDELVEDPHHVHLPVPGRGSGVSTSSPGGLSRPSGRRRPTR